MTLDRRLAEFGENHPLVAEIYVALAHLKEETGETREAMDFAAKGSGIYAPLARQASGSAAEQRVTALDPSPRPCGRGASMIAARQ